MDFKEIKNFTAKELKESLAEKRGELSSLRFSAKSGQLKQVNKISLVKKDIAKILTALKNLKTN